MRAKEIISLRFEDIDWIEGTVKVQSRKSLRERRLPLTKDVGQALAKYLREAMVVQKVHRGLFSSNTHLLITLLPQVEPSPISCDKPSLGLDSNYLAWVRTFFVIQLRPK
jgi:hypothetical protein